MNRFAALYAALDETTKTTAKVAALARYFAEAPPADAAWAVYFLCGRKPRQAVPVKRLRAWATELAGIPDWLFDESYHAVGDLAETIALLLPPASRIDPPPLHTFVEEVLLPLRGRPEDRQRHELLAAWDRLDRTQRFVANKLITGAFRVGVSQLLVVRALAQVSGVPAAQLSHRLMGDWQPTPTFFQRLVARSDDATDPSQPYPFCLAHPLDGDPTDLGPASEWAAEWKWDGIRCQVIRRMGRSFVWTRGEELVTDRYPELRDVAERLPDGTVIDGEILPWSNGQVRPFAELQKRIGRKSVTKKLLAELPVALMAYDLLEFHGDDVRGLPFTERRSRLDALIQPLRAFAPVMLSPLVDAADWDDLARERRRSRAIRVEGLMLKRRDSIYKVGRVRGDWWKWKVEPYTIDAVLVYAQRGSGKRASLYTDYTFAVWQDGKLVPFAKAYSGLTDAEIRQVDAFVRKNTVDKFGPVRTVKPELVFELGFEAIQRSARHKSGVAVRFPRMLRWRTDKTAEQADSLERILDMLALTD